MSQTTSQEQRCKDAVKKAYLVIKEGLNEIGVNPPLTQTLTMAVYPEIVKELLKQNGATQAPPTPATPPTPPVPKPTPFPSSSPLPVPLQAQVFDEFLKRLPAQLRPLLRVKDHTGVEILVVNTEKLDGSDFALVCQVAEGMGGKRVSAGKDSAWHLPIRRLVKENPT